MKRIGYIDGRRIRCDDVAVALAGQGAYLGFAFTGVGDIYFEGLHIKVAYKPTAGGYAWPTAIYGEVVLGEAVEFKTAQGGLFGVVGKLRFLDTANVNQAHSIFAALKGEIRIDGTPVFNAFDTIACVAAYNFCSEDLAGIGLYGSALFAGFQSDVGTIDTGLFIRGGNKMTNVFRFETMEGCLGNGAHAGAAKNFRVLLDGEVFYINCYAAT